MLPLKSLVTVVFFILQYVSSTLKKFHAFSPCQVFTVLSDALGGCYCVFFSFSPKSRYVVCLQSFIWHMAVLQKHFKTITSTVPLLGNKCILIYILRNLSFAGCHRNSHIVLDGHCLMM